MRSSAASGSAPDQRHAADVAAAHPRRPDAPARGAWQPSCSFASASITIRRELHDTERTAGSFAKTIEGIDWLAREGFALALAGRTCWGESEQAARDGYAALIAERGWPIDAYDPAAARPVPRDGFARRRAGDHRKLLGHPAQGPERRDVRLEPHGGEAERRRRAGRAALHAAALRSGLRDGRDAGGSRACRWRHVRAWRGQALPSALRQVLRARRRQLFGSSPA